MNKWKVGVLLSVFGFLGVMNPIQAQEGNGNKIHFISDFQSVTLRRCVTNKPPAMRVRIEGYTKKTPIAIQ